MELTMEKIRKILWKVDEALALYFVGVILIVMTSYVTANIIGRYVFNSPVKGMREWVGLLLVPLSFLGMAYGWREAGTFVAAEFLIVRMRGRLRWALEVLIQVCALIFAGFLIYGGLTSTLWAYRTMDVWGSYGDLISTWPFKASIFIGGLLLGVYPFLDIIKLCRKGENAMQDFSQVGQGPDGLT
jgi:TRAP-type C4-dicarboxylate transport system permease small subunit